MRKAVLLKTSKKKQKHKHCECEEVQRINCEPEGEAVLQIHLKGI